MANIPIFASGHFYSPIVDTDDIDTRVDEIWRDRRQIAGIDFNDASHVEILESWFPKVIGEYDYPDAGDAHEPTSFFNFNDQFSWLDARTLFVFLSELKPKRMIEVGSGYSSLLTADVNVRFLGRELDFTCIEPYPRAFLKRGLDGLTGLIAQRVQQVPLAVFEALDAGDVLFVDSSHVAKTGSDVNHLFFEVFPKLRSGVLIHVHDIFLPFAYPKQWVIAENRSWNEQYLLRALLMDSTRYRVRFGCTYAAAFHSERVVKALACADGHGMSGGEFLD